MDRSKIIIYPEIRFLIPIILAVCLIQGATFTCILLLILLYYARKYSATSLDKHICIINEICANNLTNEQIVAILNSKGIEARLTQ